MYVVYDHPVILGIIDVKSKHLLSIVIDISLSNFSKYLSKKTSFVTHILGC